MDSGDRRLERATNVVVDPTAADPELDTSVPTALRTHGDAQPLVLADRQAAEVRVLVHGTSAGDL